MDDNTGEDVLLAALTAAGSRRLRNLRDHNTSVVFPVERPDGWEAKMIKNWKESCAPEELDAYLMETVQAADSLMHFIDANVGTTVDYPVVLQAETNEALAAFQRPLARLRGMVNFMLEI